MQKQKPDFLLNEANQLIQDAKEELHRSEEDVSSYMVCQNSRKALVKSMTYFLFKNGITPKEPVTMENLFNQCKAEDARFQNVDMSGIFCRHDEHDEEYCLDTQKVRSCLKTADLIHGIIKEPVPGY